MMIGHILVFADQEPCMKYLRIFRVKTGRVPLAIAQVPSHKKFIILSLIHANTDLLKAGLEC